MVIIFFLRVVDFLGILTGQQLQPSNDISVRAVQSHFESHRKTGLWNLRGSSGRQMSGHCPVWAQGTLWKGNGTLRTWVSTGQRTVPLLWQWHIFLSNCGSELNVGGNYTGELSTSISNLTLDKLLHLEAELDAYFWSKTGDIFKITLNVTVYEVCFTHIILFNIQW